MKTLREALFNKKTLNTLDIYKYKDNKILDLIRYLYTNLGSPYNLLIVFKRNIFSHKPTNVALLLNKNIDSEEIIDDLIKDESVVNFGRTNLKKIIKYDDDELMGINFFSIKENEIKYTYLDLVAHLHTKDSILKSIFINEIIDVSGKNYKEIIDIVKNILS